MAELVPVMSNQKSEESSLIVALRIRPMNDDEIIQGATPIAHRVDDNLVILMDPIDESDDVLRQNRSREKQFMFDLALDGQASQDEVYRKTCRFLIPGVINGFNATVFAYGATGAGKTYTMLGKDDDPGIMARALTELFTEMKRTTDDLVYKVTMSYLEIYNEMIRDLLNPGSGFLDLREDHKGVQVAGLSEHSASNTDEVMAILKGGNKERTQEPTAANKTSSRSHAVLIVSVKQRQRLAGIHQQVRVGKLFLIDLAGSERAANTQNRGKRMVEGAHINRSLLALGNCINALSDKTGSKYVNYRDSKLTRLLKDSLGGNCKTVMIAHISPASFYFEESRNTLTYADRAKNIRTKVRQNVLDMTLHIAQYSNIITDLRDEIRRLRQKVDQQQQQITLQKHITSSSDLNHNNNDDNSDFQRVKNDLMNVFRTQMDLRQSLMELTNTEGEIGAEATRLQLLIKRLEHERLLSPRMQQELQEKDDQLSSNGSLRVLTSDTTDVNRAREELESLETERNKSQKSRVQLDKELVNASHKTRKIEQDLRQMCTSRSITGDQQEIVALLSKLQAVQVENTQLQSNLMQRQFDIRRRDLLLDWRRSHDGVARALIHKQKAVIDDNDITRPLELDELYDAYEKEADDIRRYQQTCLLPPIVTEKPGLSLNTGGGTNVEPLPLLFVPSRAPPDILDDGFRSLSLNKTDKQRQNVDNKTRLFVPRNSAVDDLRNGGNTFLTSVSPAGDLRSNGSSPASLVPSRDLPSHMPGQAGDGHHSNDDIEDLILDNESRRTMMYGTRGIAQLAAHRKASRGYDRGYRNNGSMVPGLTQSRLAQHDSKYTPLTGLPSHNDDVLSHSTNTTVDAIGSYPTKTKPVRRNRNRLSKQRVGFQSVNADVESKNGSRQPNTFNGQPAAPVQQDTLSSVRASHPSRLPLSRTNNNGNGPGHRYLKSNRVNLTIPQQEVAFLDHPVTEPMVLVAEEPAITKPRSKKPSPALAPFHRDEEITVTGYGIQ